MKIQLEDTKGVVVKAADIEIREWPEVVLFEKKAYVFKYENFIRSDEDASVAGRYRVYREAIHYIF